MSTRSKPDAQSPTPDIEPPTPPTPGRIVIVTFADAALDGEKTCVGLITKVNEDGDVNLRLFAPNGGADTPATGVRRLDEIDALDVSEADKNAMRSTTWDWPARG